MRWVSWAWSSGRDTCAGCGQWAVLFFPISSLTSLCLSRTSQLGMPLFSIASPSLVRFRCASSVSAVFGSSTSFFSHCDARVTALPLSLSQLPPLHLIISPSFSIRTLKACSTSSPLPRSNLLSAQHSVHICASLVSSIPHSQHKCLESKTSPVV